MLSIAIQQIQLKSWQVEESPRPRRVIESELLKSEILEVVQEFPGCTCKQICYEIPDLHQKTCFRKLNELAKEGLIYKTRDFHSNGEFGPSYWWPKGEA